MGHHSPFGPATLLVATLLWNPATSLAADGPIRFEGEKSAWHAGLDRDDYVMDDETLAITPFKRDRGEGFGVKAPEKGKRRCILIVPKRAAPANPWSWQGCYRDHEPQAEVESLGRGFHVALITPTPASNGMPGTPISPRSMASPGSRRSTA